MASVTLKGITKRWNEFVAVRDLSLLIEDQEFLVLLGPSGCGKTTTMRMIAGLEEPTLGEVFIGKRKVNDDLPKDRDVAMVFQNYGLYPHLSVYENIRYPLKVRKVPKSLHSEKVRQAAEKVQLDHLLERKPRELSGGQRQRVALARAIVRTPTVFLMDEPLSNLDAKLRVTMRAELKHLQHELKITTVYVTHDQIEAMTLADRVAVMDHRIISQLGPPEEIYNDPANLFVAGFIGSPPMNLMKGKLHDNNFQHKNFSISINHEAKLEESTLVIRPEDLILFADKKGVIQVTV
ncbi:MAG: ABC transporter ATP-binding protein, partial [bacterium]